MNASIWLVSRPSRLGKNLDCMMPDMDGFEAARRILAGNATQDTAILMLSSAGDPADAQRCAELGIDQYLRKPVSSADLRRAMMTHGDLPTETDDTPVPAPSVMTARRVLVVEDNLFSQKVAAGHLRYFGHDVIIAGDGVEALEMVSEHTDIDAILMDVSMPRMDGLAATREIRRLYTEKHIPIIALTAHARAEDRTKCSDAGMDDYLTKPLRRNDLASMLERWLPNSGEPGEAQDVQVVEDQALVVLNYATALDLAGGDKGMLQDLAAMFLQDATEFVSRIEEHSRTGDLTGVREAVHALLGMAGMMALEQVIERLGQIREYAHALDEEGVRTQASAMVEEMNHARPELEYLASTGNSR